MTANNNPNTSPFLVACPGQGRYPVLYQKGKLWLYPACRRYPLVLCALLSILPPTFVLAQSCEWSKVPRPLEELELMNERELAKEALNACSAYYGGIRVCPTPSEAVPLMRRYVGTITLVARKRHNGIMPKWAEEARKAVDGLRSSSESWKCQLIYNSETIRELYPEEFPGTPAPEK
jgi:hypothetical protein